MARPSELPALRVVLDTQVLLRGAVARTESLTSKIYDAWREGRFTLLLSEPIAAEIEEVLLRSEVLQKLHLNPIEARALVTLVRRQALFVTPMTPIRQSRDPADDKFLECAVAGEADYIVSADDDLLSLTEVQGIPVLDVPTFWRKLVELTLPG
ncbi:MAG: putative toxin-antitoxin system toxin component, PIN family [Candidatus Rokuibacteriota bacterium]